MAMLLSHQVRVPSLLGFAGLLGLAAVVSSAGLTAMPARGATTASTPQTVSATAAPAALVTASPDGAVVVAERFPANATVRIYAGAPVAGAAYQSLGEAMTDANGTAALRLDRTRIAADGSISIVVATPDFRYRATARVAGVGSTPGVGS